MVGERRNVFLLACCQALLLTNAVTLIAIGALAGYALADNKALATLPNTAYVIGVALTAFPASMWMKRVGRRAGFLAGIAIGLVGACIAAFAIHSASFALLCAGHLLLGAYNAFGQYYRFAAADVASTDFRANAISLVMAGGLVGGFIGPEVSKITIDLAEPPFLASYLSLLVYGVAAMAMVSLLQVPTTEDAATHEPARPMREIARQPRFMVAVIVGAIGYAVMNFLMTATPLAMRFCGHPYASSAGVIAAHVVAMFAPSFFTGALIQRFGVERVMAAGVAAQIACVAVALSGEAVVNFWWALVLLGLGWNFMYVGGTTLLTETYRPAEKAKAQGFNEIAVFAVQALSAFSAGVIVNAAGWSIVNYIALPLIAIAGVSLFWLSLRAGPRHIPTGPTAP
jgi:MFS family permease